MIPQSWYKYLVRIDVDAVYCDHLACCLLAELINKQQNPMRTSYRSLSDLVNHLMSDVKHSLELLKDLDLIQVAYPKDPEKLLEGAITITLNHNHINLITNCEFSSKPRTNARDGIVYVIRAGQTSLFKIGRTTNLERRFKQLQSMNHQPLTVFRVFKCYDAIATESALHQRLKQYRRSGSEWFNLPQQSIDFLQTYQGV